jgi:hypothetical protein
MVDRVEKAFEDKIKEGSLDLEEKALVNLRDLKERQKKEIEGMFDKRLHAYQYNEGKAVSGREAIAAELVIPNTPAELMTSATEEAEKKVKALEKVIKAKTKEEFIKTDEVLEIEQAVMGVEKLANEDKNLRAVAEKIMDGKQLADEDYSYIVGILNPHDYEAIKQRKDIKSSFEATSSGILVGLMKPDQRIRFIEVYMDSPKKDSSAELIDAFLSTGILTRDQGEALLQKAVQKGVITQEKFTAEFKTKLDQGFYRQETEKYRQIIEQELNRDYRGHFSENIASRVVGAPMVGGLAALWGLIETILNVWTTLGNKDDPDKLKSLLTNPYIYAGVGAMAVGTEVATGGLKKGTGLVGGGAVSRAIDSIGETEEDEKTAVQKRARERVSDIMQNSPKELTSYLENGGFVTVMELKKQKISRNEKPIITIEELLKIETDTGQMTRLQNMKTLTYASEDSINMSLTTIPEAAAILNVEKPDDFTKLVADIRAKQKPQDAAV